MARKLNTRLLLYMMIFIGVPAGLAVLGFFQGWFSGGDPEQLYKDAQAAYEQEEYAQAWIAIRQSVKAGGGGDPEVTNLMGDIAMKQTPPAVSQAIQAYRSTVHLKPDHVEAQRKLAELYIAVRYWKEALTELERLQELDPSLSEAYLWEARAHLGLAEAEPIQSKREPDLLAAIEACEEGLEKAPGDIGLYQMLVVVYSRLDREEDVDRIIDLALEENPKKARAYLMKASRLASQDKADESMAMLKQGLDTIGPNVELYMALGESSVREANLDDAKTYYAGAIETDPTHEEGYLRLAGIHRIESDREKAVEVLAQGLEQDPDSVPLLAQQADVYLEMNERQKAADAIARVEQLQQQNTNPGTAGVVDFLKGKQALLSQQVRQAITFLERAREKQQGPRASLLLGRAYMLAGELGAAEQSLQNLVDNRPGLTPAWRMLAEVELRLRQFDRAARCAAVVLDRQPKDTETRLHLARALLFQGKTQAALDQAKEAAETDKTSPEPLLLMAVVYEQTKQTDLAEETYRKALDVAEDDRQVYREFLEFYRRTKQGEKITALIKEAREALPEDTLFAVAGSVQEVEQQLIERAESADATAGDLLTLADMYRATDRLDEARNAYQRALGKAESGSSLWRRAWQHLFLLHLGSDKYEEAAALVQQLKQVNPDARELMFADPLLLLSKDKVEEATAALRQLAEQNPTLSQAHFMLAQVLAGQNRLDEAIAELTRALNSRPNLTPARLMLARIYQSRGNYAGVRSEADEALRFNPKLVQALEMKAVAHAGLGEWKSALAARQKIAATVPGNTRNLVALAALHMQQHEPKKAEEVLQRAYKQQPKNPVVVRRYAEFLAETDRADKGTEIVDAYVACHPDEARPLILRGEFTAVVAGPEKAEPYFRKAAEIAPDDPYPLVFLGDQYSNEGRWDKAAEAYREAIGRGEDSGLARKRLADVLMLQGKLDEAWKVINQVISSAPKDAAALVVAGRIAAHRNQGEKAEELVRKAIELEPGYGEARVRLAEIHAGPDPMRALDLLDDVDPADRSFEKAQLLRADINTRRVQLTEAILDLRRLLDFRPMSVPGRLQLASKYMAVEKYDLAAKLIEELSRERLDKDPDVLVALGEARMRQKSYKAALAAYEKARLVQPESSQALTGEVKALVALGQGQEALSQAHDAMNKWPKEVWPRMALVAVYKETGQMEKAFEALRTGLLRRENWEAGYVYLADLLVRAERTSEARDVLDTGLKKVPESVQIRAGLAALEIGAHGPKVAVDILEPLAKEFENKYSHMPDRLPSLRPYMPSIRVYSLALYQMGKVEEALKWGMMLWSINPVDVANANNMAWILATEQEDYDRARDMIRQVMRLMPNHPQVLDTAGWIEFLAGRHDEALERFMASIKYGDNPQARYHLGRVYEERERPDEAREEYNKAIEMGLKGDDKADAQRRLKVLATAAG